MSFYCLKCKNKIADSIGLCNCTHCHQKYVMYDGCIDFNPDDITYWGELSKKEMIVLNQMSADMGFKRACIEFFLINTERKDLLPYILNENERINFLLPVFDSSNKDVCLDIGSGLGAIPSALSKKFNKVYSIELIKERVEFQQIRRKQCQLNNWKIIKSNICELPFPDNFFDFVSVNGVLEWLPVTNYNKKPEIIQEDFLREIKRVLKPNGVCYIGIENRFGNLYFRGALDHSGIKFTSLLPRFVANLLTFIYTKIKKNNFYFEINNKVPFNERYYRTYTYSKSEYKKILANININDAEFYHTGSSYDFIKTLVKDHDIPLLHNSRSIIKKWLPLFRFSFNSRISKILAFFSQNFIIYFRKDDAKINSNIKNVARDINSNESFAYYFGFNNILLLDLSLQKMYRSSNKSFLFKEEAIVTGEQPSKIDAPLFKKIIAQAKKKYYSDIHSDDEKLESIEDILLLISKKYSFGNSIDKQIQSVFSKYRNSNIFSSVHGDLWIGNIIQNINSDISFIDEESGPINIFIVDILRFIMSITGYTKKPTKNPDALKFIELVELEFPDITNVQMFDDFYLIALFQELYRYDIDVGTPREEFYLFYELIKKQI